MRQETSVLKRAFAALREHVSVTIADLGRRWNERMLLDVCEPLAAPTLQGRSLLHAPAGPRAVSHAEARLGIRLPPSFREFLAFSNGANADWGLVTASYPRHGRTGPEFGLLPAEDLALAIELVPETVAVWDGDRFGREPPVRLNGQVVCQFEPLRDAVVVSSLTQERGKQLLCLAPTDSADAVEPYELWDRGHEEIVRYLSFADWLEHSVSDRWYDPGDVFRRVNADITPDLAFEQRFWPTPLRVHQIRRLAACSASPALARVLDQLWSERDPFVRLAAAQVHCRITNHTARVAELVECDEPSVALSAAMTMSVLT